MKYTSSKLEIISIILSLCLKPIYSYKLLNCYSSLPSSFYKDNTNEYQSSSLCYSTCSGKGYSYFALFDHNTCYCGSTSPGGLPISTSCNTYCYGYDREMCGGTSAYSIYSVDDAESVSNQESSGSPSASSRTSSTASISGTKKTSVSALAVGSSDSQIVIANEKSTSNQQQTTRNSKTGSGTEAAVATSVVYSTQLQTQGGSTIFVTNTITKSTGVLPTGSSASNNNKSSSSNSKKKVNVGAIVGGIVGGVCGALVLLSALLFGLRYYNKKREEDRMEKEYQEAIKPVEYVPVDILSSSSHSYSFDGGNMNGKLNDSLGNIGSDNLKGNNTNSNNLTVMSNTSNKNNNNNGLLSNPFDDSRRISTGSIISSDPDQNKPTKLTIVNPDE
ncbi:Slg1p PWA37_004685 [Arxiozyma heterogenica]